MVNITHLIIASVVSLITLGLCITSIIFYANPNSDSFPGHVTTKQINIIDSKFYFGLWIMHCIGILVLPWLLLYAPIINPIYFLFFPPVMMGLDLLTCYFNYIPSVIELVLTIILLETIFIGELPTNTTEKIIKELILMSLAFVYIHNAICSSYLSLYIFGDILQVSSIYIKSSSDIVKFFDDVVYLEEVFKETESYVTFENFYLCTYSFFTFLIVGLGFCMSSYVSLSMLIPFIIISVMTYLKSHIIGYVLFLQALIHIIYVIYNYCKNGCYEKSYQDNFEIIINLFSCIAVSTFGFCLPTFFSVNYILNGYELTLLIICGLLFLIGAGLSFVKENIWVTLISCGCLIASVVLQTGLSDWKTIRKLASHQLTYNFWILYLIFWIIFENSDYVLVVVYSIFSAVAIFFIYTYYDAFDPFIITMACLQLIIIPLIMAFLHYDWSLILFNIFPLFLAGGIYIFAFLLGIVAFIIFGIFAACYKCYDFCCCHNGFCCGFYWEKEHPSSSS